MILITGAAGKNGSELLRLLASRGASVRAMQHNSPVAAGTNAVQADFAKPASLHAALEGVDHVFLTTSPGEHALEQQINLIQAAKQAGVQHIVKLSMLGADPNSPSRFQRSQGEAEKALEDSGMGWTHLRPNFFMQTALQYRQGDQFYSFADEGRISVVDVHDIAHVAAAALTEPGHEGRVYDITGPQALTYAEMAAAVSATLVNLSFEQARETMIAAGFPAWNLEGVIELNRWFQTGAASVITDVVRNVGKREPRTFEQFLTASLTIPHQAVSG